MRRNGVLILVASLAIAALALSIVGLTRKTSVAAPRGQAAAVRQVDGKLSALDTRLTALEGRLGGALAASGAHVGQLRHLYACMPELLAYINSVTPQVSNGQVSLSFGQQISAYCNGVLYNGKP